MEGLFATLLRLPLSRRAVRERSRGRHGIPDDLLQRARTDLQDDGTRTYSLAEKRYLVGVIIHEVGHTYFPMIVNSDERQWTWMDEGLNSFLDAVAGWEVGSGDSVEQRAAQHRRLHAVPESGAGHDAVGFGPAASGRTRTPSPQRR